MPNDILYSAIKFIAKQYKSLQFIIINKNYISSNCLLEKEKNVHIISPLTLLKFHKLLSKCLAIVTDSGGIQEETAVIGIPTLVVRKNTERLESIENGTSKLIKYSSEAIILSLTEIIENTEIYSQMNHQSDLYGNGNAAALISKIISDILKKEK
jgi:UDP-N-acetylglucosamine 2-epimerase (non-hydrolysing)